ncbi:MAG: hypothetical protein M0R17_04530 [Candidatus Omnitrophica bacterium]|jgi:hypothetical protein|nr:hypothetical protein [Candidatus Omnitrophota bacterium]
MIEIQQTRLLNLQLQDEDIEIFISLVNKLMIATKQTGFKKPFNESQRVLIENIFSQLKLDEIESVNIYSEREQTISNDYE